MMSHTLLLQDSRGNTWCKQITWCFTPSKHVGGGGGGGLTSANAGQSMRVRNKLRLFIYESDANTLIFANTNRQG